MRLLIKSDKNIEMVLNCNYQQILIPLLVFGGNKYSIIFYSILNTNDESEPYFPVEEVTQRSLSDLFLKDLATPRIPPPPHFRSQGDSQSELESYKNLIISRQISPLHF